MTKVIRLGVNLDHIATLRNARGETYPNPLRGAKIAQQAGADNITLHLREDRRHIIDNDVLAYRQNITLPLNLEMAATAEMQQIALKVKPHTVSLVPEKREERTTEGGLNITHQPDALRDFIAPLKQANINIAFFIEPDKMQIDTAKQIGADAIELHTGRYAQLTGEAQQIELQTLADAANHSKKIGLNCHAGHGLTFDNVSEIAAIMAIEELNIGHFIISEAVFISLEHAIKKMKQLMNQARQG
ncbi:MAG: pyridoxine 5'-phosphate synthase [Alphaproteobacteria bacterium]|nr:pyridoxine 5'-phosphate synthase [Alphaproteobacteria bacterium]